MTALLLLLRISQLEMKRRGGCGFSICAFAVILSNRLFQCEARRLGPFDGASKVLSGPLAFNNLDALAYLTPSRNFSLPMQLPSTRC